MADQLKNCPSCGGTLDDTGRCPYCNSKVYDLTDINIDVNSRDKIKLKLKCGKNTMVVDCYPANISWETTCDTDTCVDIDGKVYSLRRKPWHRINLELITY